MTPSWHHDQLLDSPGGALLGPAEATAGRTSGTSLATGNVHGACEALQGGGHGPDGRLSLGYPTHAQFNCALGL